MSVRCGFIGLGIMGKAPAGNLAPKGLPTIVYDLDAAAIRDLVANAAKLKLALNVLTNLSFAASLEGMLVAKAIGLPQELCEEGGKRPGC